MAKVLALVLGAMLVTACGGTAAIPAASKAAVPSGTSTLALSSAIVGSTTAASTLLACHGEAFCREDVIASGHEDTRADTADRCREQRGTVSSEPCPRERAVGSCSLGGEAGPITVYTYAQRSPTDQADALATMKDLCEQMSGELEVAAD